MAHEINPDSPSGAVDRHRPWAGYALAAGAVALGWLLYLGLTAWVGEGLPTYITFYPAVLATALLGGLGPGLLATLLAATSVVPWLLPLDAISGISARDLVGLALFSTMCVFMNVVAESYRRSCVRAAALEHDTAARRVREQTADALQASESRYHRCLDERLQQERALLASVTAATDIMLVYLDPAFNFVWVNPAYVATSHIPMAALIGQNHFALYPHEENEAIFRGVRDTGVPVFFKDKPFEFPDQPERGVTYWDWSLTAVHDGRGAVSGLVFSLRETTPDVRGQQALRASEERYRRLFENMDAGLALHEIITDANARPTDARFIEVNPAFEQLSGLKRADLLGKRLLDVLPETEHDWIEAYGRVALSGVAERFENPVDFLGRWYEVHAYQAAPRQFVTIFDDVTERRATAAALAAAKNAAELANRAKSAFLANMSHEIRTPLHVITGLGRLLRRDIGVPAQRQRLDNLCATADHLHAIINNILDLAKIEAGEFALDHDSFRLDALLENVQCMVAERAREKGLQLTLDVAPALDGIHLMGDALRLEQVLINLCANAVKFTEQGTVRLGIDCRAESAAGLALHFAVTDSGIGIAPADQAQLFQPFIQVDSASTRQRGGTGLGLSISQRIVALMGGALHVASQPGQGSTFSFDLLLPRAPAASEMPAVAAPPPDFHGRRVLFAEDHPLSQEILLEMLEDLGCTADVAADGVEAVACAQARGYDLIVLDMQMPNMDGLAAVRAIRALPQHRATPIVALTANAFASDHRRCLAAGMNGHIGKPVTPATLAAALSQWLPALTLSTDEKTVCENDVSRALDGIVGLEVAPNWRSSPEQLTDYCRLLERFLQLHRQDMAQLSEHLAAGERDAALVIAHNLQGIAGFIGAQRITALASEMLQGLRAGADPADIPALADSCAAELERLGTAVRAAAREGGVSDNHRPASAEFCICQED